MIEVSRVSKKYRIRNGWKTVLADLNFTLPPGRSIGILGRNGAGKSTLIRLIAGLEKPDSGTIHRHGKRVSWPLRQGGGVHGSLSGRENVKFICRIYGVDYREKVEFVEDFAALGAYMDEPVRTYSSGMKARLTFGISMAFDFDIYLIDEGMGGGDARFKSRFQDAFEEKRRKNNCGMIVVSHNEQTVRRLCDIGAVLEGGKLTLYDQIDEAISVYQNL